MSESNPQRYRYCRPGAVSVNQSRALFIIKPHIRTHGQSEAADIYRQDTITNGRELQWERYFVLVLGVKSCFVSPLGVQIRTRGDEKHTTLQMETTGQNARSR